MSVQALDSIGESKNPPEYTVDIERPLSFLFLLRTRISPNIIYNSNNSITTILKSYYGEWKERWTTTGHTCTIKAYFKVQAFGRPIPHVTVTLFERYTRKKIATTKTDRNGIATFVFNSDAPTPPKSYIAVIGEKYPIRTFNNPRAYPFRVGTWLLYYKVKNETDKWLRLVGRAYDGNLPHKFWREKPRTVVGRAGTLREYVGFTDLLPVISGVEVPIEVGISAYCNTPEAYPPSDKCCEYAKNTWWRVDLYATNRPEELTETIRGEKNHIGGDSINLDYHLKFRATTDSVTYLGKCLKYARCPWESGTAPSCGGE
ncbi:MAG TPA: hypothetical protein ENF41_04400 [Candidatus Bathyarchaeota archaeon]|nr:hypothetical protein [Candidatus Bathyarchaeota archaeon]